MNDPGNTRALGLSSLLHMYFGCAIDEAILEKDTTRYDKNFVAQSQFDAQKDFGRTKGHPESFWTSKMSKIGGAS